MKSFLEYSEMYDEFLCEGAPKIVFRVSSNGKKTRRIVCGKGQRKKGRTCVPQSGKFKMMKRIAARKSKLTRRAHAGKQRMAVRKRQMALKRRKSMGLGRRRH